MIYIPVDAPPSRHAQGVLDAAQDNPDAFDMGNWFYVEDGTDDVLRADDEIACGTTMCAAGWVCHNAGFDLFDTESGVMADQLGHRSMPVVDRAAKMLGLTMGQANDLFVASDGNAIAVLRRLANGENWPEEVKTAYAFAARGALG